MKFLFYETLILIAIVIYIIMTILYFFKIIKYKININTSVLLFIIFCIFLLPIILLPTNILDFLDGKGEIGDSIGGFTAPFIGGLNAILVYMAFKQQIKANKLLENFEREKMIIDAINWLREDKYEIGKLTDEIEKNAKDFEEKIIEISFMNFSKNLINDENLNFNKIVSNMMKFDQKNENITQIIRGLSPNNLNNGIDESDKINKLKSALDEYFKQNRVNYYEPMLKIQKTIYLLYEFSDTLDKIELLNNKSYSNKLEMLYRTLYEVYLKTTDGYVKTYLLSLDKINKTTESEYFSGYLKVFQISYNNIEDKLGNRRPPADS